MILKRVTCASCIFTALVITIAATTPTRTAEQTDATIVTTDRLSFPEPVAADAPTAAALAVASQDDAPQPVALPTPQFTGFTAVATLGVLLMCRKSILRLVV
jgi:hypothetical protein